ncbi:polymorphic toxin-type HINT domain-containing protein [Kitasatospora purpeofusca]|uniref:polymorphic toxin-type HINT domain-containing protein n=1 Tax=Kitasatospora purpeofusca TaxID=67352 RepID=UPI00381D92F2
MTGTATVTIGADSPGAKVARSATGGAAPASGGGTALKAGSLAVEVGPTGGQGESARKVTVQVTTPEEGKAAGVNAALVAFSDAEPAAAPEGRSVSVTLDLKALQAAGWSDRAALVALPACALTTPARPECRTKTPVPSRTDGKGKLTADITLPQGSTTTGSPTTDGTVKAALAATDAPAAAFAATGGSASAMVLAAAPAPNGALGNYAATPLSPSAAWSAGSNSGNFTYSYPIQVPPSLGGAAPGVALAYNSASVDGKTSATNAQPSWIGDGWGYEPGYIERSYKPCDKAGIAHSADQCWGGENATLVLGGRSGTIVRDDASGSWHLQNDDGSKVERLTGAPRTVGDVDYHAMEYWRITTTDGIQYYFGLNHLPGGDGTDPAANSVLTMPVYSPNAKDACYNAATGSGSWCQMAWRWQLDYVVDAHGNLTNYGYATEVNKYSRGYVQSGGNGSPTEYQRAGYLREIGYGQRLDDQRAAKGTLNPAAKVLFEVEERCDPAKASSCAESERTAAHQEAWPDVPIDQICADNSCSNASPTFFTTKRLTKISTQVLVDSAYRTVDTWKLDQHLADPGDGTPRILQLDSVQRIPSNGHTAIDNLPPVAFEYDMMANRVDGIELQSEVREGQLFMRPRLKGITTETGGRVNVIYRTAECSRLEGRMPASEDGNTLACIPVKWYLPGQSSPDPVNDWFNKPVVETVTEQDLVTSPAVNKVTSYDYGDRKAAWHRNDAEFADPKTRTWDNFRGYSTVITTTGSGTPGEAPRSQQKATYLRGMDDDYLANGTRRSVSVANPLGGPSVLDSDWRSGQILATEVYSQADGPVRSVSGSTSSTAPGENPVSATHKQEAGAPNSYARRPESRVTTLSAAKLADDSWRLVTIVTVSDPTNGNRVLQINDKGDGTAATPETCTSTKYASSTDSPQTLTLASEQVTVHGPCGTVPTSANTITGSRTLYDGKPLGQFRTAGDPTSTQVLDHFDQGGNPVYVNTGSAIFDAYGRGLTSSTTDGSTYNRDGAQLGGPSVTPAVTTVALSPATGALPTEVRTTGPMGADWTSTVTQDPARGSSLTNQDVNGRVTTAKYDALGRATEVWAPDRPTNALANRKFTYAVNGTAGPSWVKSETLNDDKATHEAVIEIFDGLGRPRQTQSTSAAKPTGRLITDTVYDSHGWVIKTTAPYYEGTAFPKGSIFAPQDSQVPSATWTSFDGNGRVVRSEFRSNANLQWASTTAYPGADRTDVTPPAGGTPTSAVTDARGRTVAAWQYRTPTATGNATDADVTTFGFTAGGLASRRTDSSGNNWTYEYDLRGRQVSASDPDTGVTRTYYNVDSQIDHTTDANGNTLAYSYDLLGRKTGMYTGSVAPANQLAGWTYDTLAKGKSTSSTRFVGGAAGAAYTKGVTGYDTAYRPLGTSVTIPKVDGVEGALAGTYTTTSSYTSVLGALDSFGVSAAGGLPAESVSYARTITGLLTDSASLGKAVVAGIEYDALARPTRTGVGEFGKQLVATQQYDWATGRLINNYVDRQFGTVTIDQASYTYAPSGRITSVTDLQNATARDSQCFTYDHLGRLTRAWSDTAGVHTTADWTDSSGATHGSGHSSAVAGTGGCNNADGPATTAGGSNTVGGPAPYWQDYSYDAAGNRTALTQHGSNAPTQLDPTRVTQVASAADGDRTWAVALSNGSLWLGSQTADGTWSQFTDLAAEAGSLSAISSVAIAVSDGRPQIMAVAGGKIWHTVRGDNGWQKWGDVYSAVGSLSQPSQIALAATSSGLEVLALAGGRLWHTVRRPDGNWQAQGWGDVYGAVGALSSPTQLAAAATASGLEIVVSASDRLWHTVRRPDGNWQAQGWGDVYGATGALSEAQTGQGQLALANTNDGLQVVALAQGKPHHVIRNGAGDWSSWGDVTGVAGRLDPVGSLSAAGLGNDLKVLTAGSGKVNLTVRSGATKYWSFWSTVPAYSTTNASTTQTFGAARTANTPTQAPNTGGGTGGPHALLTSTTATAGGTKAVSYQYDARGNTTAITDTGGTTNLTWNGEDKLSSVTRTGQAGATTYLYDADGNQLIRRNPGKITLNLPTDEVTLDTATGAMSNVRTVGGGGGLTYTRVTASIGGGTAVIQAADPHGTNGVQIAMDGPQSVTRRPTDPFGNPRGVQPNAFAWAGTKGFVGGSKDDTTGFTNLGARQYDPSTGRFISPDPILDATNPQQWNGYAYSENDPINLSDPSGYKSEECGTLYDCGSAGTITMKNTAETTSTYVAENAQIRNYEATLSATLGPTAQRNWIREQTSKNNASMHGWGNGVKKKSLLDKIGEGAEAIGSVPGIGVVGDIGSVGVHILQGKPKEVLWDGIGFIPVGGDWAKAAHLKNKADDLAAAAIACERHSFPPGTLVLMADGTTLPIEDVKPGDAVTSTDPQTGETASKPVTAKIVTPDDAEFTELTVTDAGASTTITSTSHHPYWDETAQRWIPAAELQPGHHLTTPDHTPLTVLATRTYTTTPQRADDLTVDDLHTYYVLAGTTPVLVHNCPFSERASEIHGAEPDDYVKDNISTVAVVRVQTPHGPVDLIAGSGDGLTPAQMSVPLKKGELHVPNIPGTHAEQNAFLYANANGWKPVAGGTSRNVCLKICAPWIRGTGGKMMGNVFPGNGVTTTRQRSFEW